MEPLKKFDEFTRVDEASLSRIWQHVTHDTSFGVISAYRGNLSHSENLERHEALKRAVHNMDYGFIEQKGGYTYMDGDKEEAVEERSLFIPKVKLNDIIALGKKFNQETIIFKDPTRFDLIRCDNKKVEMSFTKEPNKAFSFDKETLKYAWSQLAKPRSSTSGGGGHPFSFRVREMLVPTAADSLKALKEGRGLCQATWIDLF